MTALQEVLKTMDYGPAPEASDHVDAWLARHQKGFGHFIGGRFREPDGPSFAVENPATGEVLVQVAQGQPQDIDEAVKAAREAFLAWSKLSGHERAKHLYAIARTIQKRARFLAVLESIDNGKPIRESRDIDIPLVARHFYHHAGWAEILESEFPGFAPLGVCGQIIPWNFPLLMLAWKIAPALAAGNTVVLKPAEYTPLTALAFAEICQEIGLPVGVVNIVTGDGTTGAALVSHDDVDKIAFTGSTEVGRQIRIATAGSGKKLTLELGGKSPFIVFADADLDAAVEGVVDAIWFNQGQVCCAGSRILVQERVERTILEKLRARMRSLRVGSPLDKSIDVGAIVHPVQLARIKELVALGEKEGATLHQADCPLPSRGSWFAPGFFSDVEPASTIAQEEIFGPVATLTSFRTPSEAVQLANNTRYGLAASIWSENINLALDIASRIKAGVVWLNATNIFDAGAGFGGYRESGFGREGAREGLYEYLRDQTEAGGDVIEEPVFNAIVGGDLPEPGGRREGIDRSAKLYIGGKQARPDSGYSYAVHGSDGQLVELAGLGNRKDVRNAVEAADRAAGWSSVTGHNRSQVIYYIAENLDQRRKEFVERLRLLTGTSEESAAQEVAVSIHRIFWYAAQADKYEGLIHPTLSRYVSLALNEPFGVVGIACPQPAPFLGFISLVMPAIAMGNRVIVIPSETHPLLATDFYQILETSDVPAGVVNIVTGERETLSKTLAEHDDVAAMWYFGSAKGSADVERWSAGNLKVTWVNHGRTCNWLNDAEGQGRLFLRKAVQVKNVWAPYGE